MLNWIEQGMNGGNLAGSSSRSALPLLRWPDNG